MNMKLFLERHRNDIVTVHATIFYCSYSDYDEEYATVTKDMTTDDVYSLCAKICDEYVKYCIDDWLSNTDTGCIDYMSPTVWLSSKDEDGEIDEYTVIDEEVHCNYSIYTAIIDDMDAVNFCTSDGYEYHEIDGDVTRSIVEYFANTLEELAKQIAEAHDATYVEIFNGYCNRLNGGVYEYYKSYNSYDGFPSIPLIEWKADDDEN